MYPVVDRPVLYRYSTNDLPLAERGRMVRELYERDRYPVRLAPLREDAVCLDVRWQLLPGLGIMSGRIGGLHVLGVPEQRGNDDLTFMVSLNGGSVISQRGRQITLDPGAAIAATRQDGGFTLAKPKIGRFVSVRVPRSAMVPLVSNIDDAIMRVMSPDTRALMLLVKYVDALAQDGFATCAELGRLITTHIHDLVAVSLGANRDAAAFIGARGVQAARLRTIKADIEANLQDCDLRASILAQRHGISARYLHKLFERDGTSFSEFVLTRRLARSYRILSDPRFLDRAISSIAFDIGFGDVSHFNHCFRRRFGLTPSDVRAQARSVI